MNLVVVNALTTTVDEMGKLATSIVEYKKATYAIDAKLAEVETMANLEHARIKAGAKQAKKQIKAQASAFHEQLQSFNKDKKAIQKQIKFCHEQALNFSLTAEQRQEAREMMQMLMAQMNDIRHDQLTSQNGFNHSVGRIGGHQHNGKIIDVDYYEK